MAKELELFDGTLLEFPDETPDDVMLAAGKRETLKLQGTLKPLPEGVTPSAAGAGRGEMGGRPLPRLGGTRAEARPFVAQEPETPPLSDQRTGPFEWDRSSKDLLMGGVEQLKSIGEGARAFPAAASLNAKGATVAAFDAIDAGQPVPPGASHPRVQAYADATPEMRARIREPFAASMAQDREFLTASVQTIKQYQAESQRLTGKMPDFTDIRSVQDFGVWLGKQGIVGTPTIVASMIGAAAGPLGLAVTSGGMAIGDMTANRAQFAGQHLDPSRFTSPDRIADSIERGDAAQHLANTAGQTAVLAPLYAAGDFLGPAGTLARSVGKPVVADTIGGALRQGAVQGLKDIPQEFVGEASQGVVNKVGERMAGEQAGPVTGKDVLDVINEGAAGAAASPVGSAAKTGIDAARVALRPTERRQAALDRLDDFAAQHGLPRSAVEVARKATDTVPLAELPGRLKRFVQALAARGVYRGPAEDESRAALDEQPTMATAAGGAGNAVGADQTPNNAPPAAPINAAAPGGASTVSAVVGPAPGAAAPQHALPVADLLDADTGLAERSPVDDAAHAAATSPENDLSEPTEAQAKAGNYSKGHARIAGLDISIENPEGSMRRGVDDNGEPWETKMTGGHYGYVRGTKGADKDHVDVFVKPGTAPDFRGPVFVIDQLKPATGAFDEAKVMLGYASPAEAEAAYMANYEPGWKGLGAITPLPLPAFKAWATSKEARKPLGDIDAARTASDAGPAAADAGRSDRGDGVLEQPGALAADAQPADGADMGGQRADELRPEPTVRADALNSEQSPANPVAESLAPGRSGGDGAVARAQGAMGRTQRMVGDTVRVIARAGKTPNSADDITLRDNGDGTVTPHLGDYEMTDYESGEPLRLHRGISDSDAKKAIRKAGAVSNKTNFFAPRPIAPAPPNAAAQAATPAQGTAAVALASGSVHGYLEPGTTERDYKEAGERAKEMVKAALNKAEPQTLDEMVAEAQATLDAEMAEYEAQRAQERAEAAAEDEAERQALMAEAELPLGVSTLDDSDIPFDWQGKPDGNDQGNAQGQDAGQAGSAEEARPAEVGAADVPGSQAQGDQGEGSGEGLTAPTPESLQAAEDRTRTAERADAAEQKRLADKAKADAERDEFTLTGSSRPADIAAAAGQQDLLAEPALRREKTETESAQVELRKRASVLEALRKCLES